MEQRDLAALERQIYNYESTYLKESPQGNVVRGWLAYQDPSDAAGTEIKESDRIFSMSSTTYKAAVEANGRK